MNTRKFSVRCVLCTNSTL